MTTTFSHLHSPVLQGYPVSLQALGMLLLQDEIASREANILSKRLVTGSLDHRLISGAVKIIVEKAKSFRKKGIENEKDLEIISANGVK